MGCHFCNVFIHIEEMHLQSTVCSLSVEFLFSFSAVLFIATQLKVVGLYGCLFKLL